jgi:hypothetical protein
VKLPKRLPAVRAGALLAVVLPVLILAAGLSGAVRARSAELSSGAAWLLSNEGQVILVSGPAARRVFATRVSEPDSRLSLVQTNEAAYVLTSAAVLRLDTATLRITARFDVPNPGPAARILTGSDRVFVVDGSGVVHTLDLDTLEERAPVRSLDGQLGEGTAVVDAANRLWTVDGGTGALHWLDDAGTGSGSAGPGSMLVVAGGEAVAVGAGNARWLDSTGEPTTTLDLGVLSGEQPVVAGTPDGRLLVAIAARKLVKVCSRESCAVAQIPDAGDRLGTPSLFDDVVLVPDLTNGTVHLVRIGIGQFANPRVLDEAAPFAVLVHDGFVFYNDVASERAGVLRINDDDTSATTAVEKYKVQDPNEGLDSAVSETSASSPSSASSEAPPSSTRSSQPIAPATSAPRSTTSASVRTTVVPSGGTSRSVAPTTTPRGSSTGSSRPATTIVESPATTYVVTSPPVATTSAVTTSPRPSTPPIITGSLILPTPIFTIVPFPTLVPQFPIIPEIPQFPAVPR